MRGEDSTRVVTQQMPAFGEWYDAEGIQHGE